MGNRTPFGLLGLAVVVGFAGFAGISGFAGNAEAGPLGAGIHDAAALSPAYGFAERCVAKGDLARSELEHFQTRVLDALEEKYSLAVDERQILKAYLVGSAEFAGAGVNDQVVPARGEDPRSCDTATEIAG